MNNSVLKFVLCIILLSLIKGLYSKEWKICCNHGELFASKALKPNCANAGMPANVRSEQTELCQSAVKFCCEGWLTNKKDCDYGIQMTALNICSYLPVGGTSRTCCQHCKMGDRVGKDGFSRCGEQEDFLNDTYDWGEYAFYHCCKNAAEANTTIEYTTEIVNNKKERCDSCDHICRKDNGKTRCDCFRGFKLKTNKTSCEDINECLEGTHDCNFSQECINLQGGYSCLCKKGLHWDVASNSCVDIDECTLKKDNCAAGQHCVNLVGSFACVGDIAREKLTEVKIRPSKVKSILTTTLPLPLPSSDFEPTPPIKIYMYSTTTPVTMNENKLPVFSGYDPDLSEDQSQENIDETAPETEFSEDMDDVSKCLEDFSGEGHGLNCFSQAHIATPSLNTSDPAQSRFFINLNEKTRIEMVDCHDGQVLGPYQICKETNKKYTCKWPPGDRNEAEDCEDIDKCSDENMQAISVGCPINYLCVTTLGSNTCECIDGYSYESNECVDVDECRETPKVCEHGCENTLGGYTCSCNNGYQLNEYNKTCVDINECSDENMQADCPYNSLCVNTLGSYTCECIDGYSYESNDCVDVDECRETPEVCEHGCGNTLGGYTCYCDDGYQLNEDNKTCVDIDECEFPFLIPGGPCSDDCINTYGSFHCACPDGYRLEDNERNCSAIDECENNGIICGDLQQCVNEEGVYSCQCPSGYFTTFQYCEDINECSNTHAIIVCPYNSFCVNTLGSYTCECIHGYSYESNECVDVDECRETPEVCEHGCRNTLGGYTCYCDDGYQLNEDNKTCIDIDECEYPFLITGQQCTYNCVNTAGSFTCTCPEGYRLEDERNCVDIDECASGEDNCGNGEGDICINMRGSYYCYTIDCPPGYTLDTSNRCVRNGHQCRVTDTECLNRPSAISYNFITFVSHLPLSMGKVDLFTMRGPAWRNTYSIFDLRLSNIKAPPGVEAADKSCFNVVPHGNEGVVSLRCYLQGPQEIKLELSLYLYQGHQYIGHAVARLVILVSEYDF